MCIDKLTNCPWARHENSYQTDMTQTSQVQYTMPRNPNRRSTWLKPEQLSSRSWSTVSNVAVRHADNRHILSFIRCLRSLNAFVIAVSVLWHCRYTDCSFVISPLLSKMPGHEHWRPSANWWYFPPSELIWTLDIWLSYIRGSLFISWRELFTKTSTYTLTIYYIHFCHHPLSTASQSYSLRRRTQSTHSYQLPGHSTYLSDCNFLTRMLYKNSY